MNAAYTARYQAYREQIEEQLFWPADQVQPEAEVLALSPEYSLRSQDHAGEIAGRDLYGSAHELLDAQGRILYSWHDLDADGEFCQLITHANGQQYLIFRQDLYGYSVLEVQSGRAFHYLPEEAFPEDAADFRETFIWTDVHYDLSSSLLAVTGCYWASPYSVLLLDFTEPLQEQPWLEVHELLDPAYEKYDDIDFTAWLPGEGLLLEGYDIQTEKKERLLLSIPTIRQELAQLAKALRQE